MKTYALLLVVYALKSVATELSQAKTSLALGILLPESQRVADHVPADIIELFDENQINYFDPGEGLFSYAKFGDNADITPVLRQSQTFVDPRPDMTGDKTPNLLQIGNPVQVQTVHPIFVRHVQERQASKPSNHAVVGLASFGEGNCINCKVSFTLNLNNCNNCCKTCTSTATPSLPRISLRSSSRSPWNSSFISTSKNFLTGSSLAPTSARSTNYTIAKPTHSMKYVNCTTCRGVGSTVSYPTLLSGITSNHLAVYTRTVQCPTCPSGYEIRSTGISPFNSAVSTAAVSTKIHESTIVVWKSTTLTQTLICTTCPGHISLFVHTTVVPCPSSVAMSQPFQATSVPMSQVTYITKSMETEFSPSDQSPTPNTQSPPPTMTSPVSSSSPSVEVNSPVVASLNVISGSAQFISPERSTETAPHVFASAPVVEMTPALSKAMTSEAASSSVSSNPSPGLPQPTASASPPEQGTVYPQESSEEGPAGTTPNGSEAYTAETSPGSSQVSTAAAPISSASGIVRSSSSVTSYYVSLSNIFIALALTVGLLL